jgi:hypothetical protein
MIRKADIIKERDEILRWAKAMSADIKELQEQVMKDKRSQKITVAEWRGKILRLRVM